jgi:polygalacturonase
MTRLAALLLLAAASCAPLLAPFCAPLFAQDTRTVTEPRVPPACTTLDAQLTSSGKSLPAADETRLDTDRIQKALDACGTRHSVVLHKSGVHDAFLSGPLQLREGVTLVVDAGVTLFASRDADLYATSPGSCGLVNDQRGGCKPLISAQHIAHAGLMGDGTIDGRGGEKYLNRDVSAWDLAEQARAGGNQQVSRIFVADYADDFTLYRLTLKNSSNFHVVYGHGNGFTVWGLKIDTPQRLARNTDGVDPGNGTKNVTITHSFIRTGDDNVALKGGPGGITNVSVVHNHFYWGHGMSIGSETDGGVSAIRVSDLSLDGPDNGIRIKSNGSRGGLTHDVQYVDVCIRNSPNPITLDTGYTAAGTLTGNRLPIMRDILLKDIRISGGGKISFNGYDSTHRVAAQLDNVLITDDATYTYPLHHADLVFGPGPVNLKFTPDAKNIHEDSTIKGVQSTGTPASCADKFLPFPAQ